MTNDIKEVLKQKQTEGNSVKLDEQKEKEKKKNI